jgi:hypothetical protein
MDQLLHCVQMEEINSKIFSRKWIMFLQNMNYRCLYVVIALNS